MKVTTRLAARAGRAEPADPADSAPSSEVVTEAANVPKTALPSRENGPWDVRELTGGTAPIHSVAYLDLGSLVVPELPDSSVQVEMLTDVPHQVAITHAGATLRLAAFAAPLSTPTWAGLVPEIAASLTADGYQISENSGPFGAQLTATLDTEDQPLPHHLRVFGVDGPGWLLRATLTLETPDVDLLEAAETGIPLDDADHGADERERSGRESAREQVERDWRAASATGEDGLPTGLFGDLIRGTVIRRHRRPLAPGTLLPITIDPQLVSSDTALAPGGEAAAPRFASLTGVPARS